MTLAVPEPAACQCMRTWSYISPTHGGHCCFVPYTQSCHPLEFAAWQAERDRRNSECRRHDWRHNADGSDTCRRCRLTVRPKVTASSTDE